MLRPGTDPNAKVDKLSTPDADESNGTTGRDKRRRRRANALDGKTWTRYSISVWSDIKKTAEENALKHPAMFPIALAQRVIQCFMSPDDRVVLDPFVGVGSTVLAAEIEEKTGIGIEISAEFAGIAEKRLHDQPSLFRDGVRGQIMQDDARNLLQHVNPGSVDLIITSPPYWDILTRRRTADYKAVRHYGDAEQDLGKISAYADFLQALSGIFADCLEALKPAKYAAVVVMDIRKRDRFYPFHADLAQALEDVGFVLDDMVIWDRRHEYNLMRPLGYPSVFRINKAHEYVLIFTKPAKRSRQRGHHGSEEAQEA